MATVLDFRRKTVSGRKTDISAFVLQADYFRSRAVESVPRKLTLSAVLASSGKECSLSGREPMLLNQAMKTT